VRTPETRAPDTANRNWIIFLSVAVLLIGNFLYRTLVPAHEYPMRDDQVMTMGFDLMLIVGLIGMKRQVARGNVLFWVALAAGIGLFAIRLTGDAQWWTGHLVYYLEPR
jgi:hypothetical protein